MEKFDCIGPSMEQVSDRNDYIILDDFIDALRFHNSEESLEVGFAEALAEAHKFTKS
jgi:hypothetical protein